MAYPEQVPIERPGDPTTRPLSYRTARETGISRRSLDGPLWRRTSRGFYVWAGGDPDDVGVCVAQAAALLPTGAAVSGWASLYLQGALDLDGSADLRVGRVAGLRRPRGMTPRPNAPAVRAGRAPVLVSVGPGARIRPRTGLDLSRRELPDDEVVMVGDVPCVVARRAVVELMGRQPAEEALVVIDAFLRAGLGELEEVHAYLDEHPRIHAAARIRRLLSLADGRARSCPESRLRWIWVAAAGLPRPLVNAPIRDAAGRLLGLPDLLDEDSGLVGEYDGAHHRALVAHTDDNMREEDFERHNLLVVRATSIDIFRRRPQLVQRLRAGHRDGLRRDRSRDGWVVDRIADR